MNNNDTFYTDHWRDIEPERIARYEELFKFRSEQQPFIDALDLEGATRVLDYGCGPGYMSEAIAAQCEAAVVGADLNVDFIKGANGRGSRVEFVHLGGNQELGMFDRILCKNVLEYVPDIDETIAQFQALLNPGGKVLLIDSDWQFVLVEPWGGDRTQEFFKAAAGAFREPEAGRKLPGALARAGFDDIHVRCLAGVDRQGRGLAVIRNMVSYIENFGSMPSSEVAAMLEELEKAIETGEFMFILPQFLVTGVRS